MLRDGKHEISFSGLKIQSIFFNVPGAPALLYLTKIY